MKLLEAIKIAQEEYFISHSLRNHLKEIASGIYHRENSITPLVERILIFCELHLKDVKSANQAIISQKEELSLFEILK
jgi:hypothetical protein